MQIIPHCSFVTVPNASIKNLTSAVSAKIYYASLCVTNDVGRSIVLKPDKGNPEGFQIVPDSTLEVTLMSMSTDGAPIKPVYFEAHDIETQMPLKINDFGKPFPVTPTDGRKPCKALVVTVPRKYFTVIWWPELNELGMVSLCLTFHDQPT